MAQWFGEVIVSVEIAKHGKVLHDFLFDPRNAPPGAIDAVVDRVLVPTEPDRVDPYINELETPMILFRVFGHAEQAVK